MEEIRAPLGELNLNGRPQTSTNTGFGANKGAQKARPSNNDARQPPAPPSSHSIVVEDRRKLSNGSTIVRRYRKEKLLGKVRKKSPIAYSCTKHTHCIHLSYVALCMAIVRFVMELCLVNCD